MTEDPRLITPESVMDAFGEFLRAFREYDAALKSGGAVGDEVERSLEKAFDQLTALSARLVHLRLRSQESVRTQEEERKRLSRELHDGPAQRAAGLVRHVEAIERLAEYPEKRANLPAALQEIKSELRDAVAELRTIISDLRPPELDQLGLRKAVERQAARVLEKSGLKWQCSWPEEINLDAAESVLIFRILQEAISNAAKHSQGTRVEIAAERIRIEPFFEEIRMSVSDDGKGGALPHSDELLKNHKFGLTSMKERAEILGGTIFLGSNKGQGFTMTLSFRRRLNSERK